MATTQEYFEHLAQSYGVLKADPAQRRKVAEKLITFLENEEAYTSFEAPPIEVHEIAPVDETTEAESEAPLD